MSALNFVYRFAMMWAAVAIVVGVIGKTKPELFLQLPMGFIPWAITGNIMPPYFDPSPWDEDEMKTWIKDGDLVAAVGAKSGTNWMLYCAHQIRTKAKHDTETDYRDILLTTPWIGFNMLPGQTWPEIKEKMNTTVLDDGTKVKDYWDSPEFPFRIFKTHFAPPTLPVKRFPNVKFLAMSRDGMDVVSSFYPFFAGHRESFKKVWGGFPPTYADPMSCLKDFLPGGTLDVLYFKYVKDWWPFRNEPNVLLLHYADAKEDLAGTVTQLAEFLDVELDEAEHAEVTRRCDISHMKTVAHKFDYVQWAGDGSKVMCGKDGCPGVDGSLIRNGEIGEGETFFTPEMKELWDAAIEQEFGGMENRHLKVWAKEGGNWWRSRYEHLKPKKIVNDSPEDDTMNGKRPAGM